MSEFRGADPVVDVADSSLSVLRNTCLGLSAGASYVAHNSHEFVQQAPPQAPELFLTLAGFNLALAACSQAGKILLSVVRD